MVQMASRSVSAAVRSHIDPAGFPAKRRPRSRVESTNKAGEERMEQRGAIWDDASEDEISTVNLGRGPS